MNYDINEIFKKISESIEVIYITDSDNDTYITLKDNALFHSMFGDSGSYQKMMNLFMENTIDKTVAASEKYRVFFKESGKLKGKFSNKSKMRIENKELIISMLNFPLEDGKCALLITETDEIDYIQDVYKNEKVNAIKSAYLFSMNVDLIEDTCGNMSMSEVDDNPVNMLDLSYTQWRSTIVNMFPPEDQKIFMSYSDPEFLKNNLDFHHAKSTDCQMMNLEGKFIWVKLIFNRVDTGNPDDFRFIFMVEDIHESHTRLMEELQKYEDMAKKDSLTGLFNHGRIESEIAKQLEICRAENKPVSLIMFDIDHFKHVNDTYGHATGDYVLKTLSKMARIHLKDFGCQLGRWGGEEFIGVAAGVSEDIMFNTAEDLRKKISETEFETVGHITSSFGVIEVNENETAKDAFERIDSALYKAKEGGRNQVIKG